MNEAKLEKSKYFCKGNIDKVMGIPCTKIIDNGIDEKAKYTFLIPTYKRVKDLSEALDSVLAQKTDIPYNIIVSDDNPERNDQTEELMTTKYKSVKNLQYYKNSQNLNQAGNWNRVFQLCPTEYGILFHDDDVLFDYYLTYMDKIVSKHPEITAINCSKIYWGGDSETKIPAYEEPKYINYQTMVHNYFLYCFTPPTGMVIKVDAVKEVGGFLENAGMSIDYVFVLTLLLRKKFRIAITNHPLMFYRIVGNTSSKKDTIIRWIEEQYEMKTELSELLGLKNTLGRLEMKINMGNFLRKLKDIHGVTITYKGYKAASDRLMKIKKIILLCTLYYSRLFSRARV